MWFHPVDYVLRNHQIDCFWSQIDNVTIWNLPICILICICDGWILLESYGFPLSCFMPTASQALNNFRGGASVLMTISWWKPNWGTSNSQSKSFGKFTMKYSYLYIHAYQRISMYEYICLYIRISMSDNICTQTQVCLIGEDQEWKDTNSPWLGK